MPAFKFKGVDFAGFDSLLSQDELLVRDNTRKWVEEKIIPIIEQCNREGRFPRELVPEMGSLGFFGANLRGTSGSHLAFRKVENAHRIPL